MPLERHYIGVGLSGNRRLNRVSSIGAMQAPHPPLKDYYAHEADRHGWVRRLFDQTAGDYDRVERAMAFGSGSWYRRRALAQAGLRPGMRVLDVGVGTGLTAREAANLVGSTGQVTGVDPSAGMMECAIVPAGVKLLLGRADSVPLPPEAVDFISMGYALRHVADLSLAFREFKRVLVPGGRLCVLEITSPTGRASRTLLKAYMRGVVPFMARYIARHRDVPKLMRYYWDTIEACASPSVIMSAIRDAGFVDVERTVSLGIFSEYCARKPLG
jgi:demethylmenaquinone methyltransferase/2-methoxy-6-polyprenyl-1,4-benzoquinol methylase